MQTHSEKFEIVASKQLLVEGEDDKRIFECLLRQTGSEDFQVTQFGGKHNLRAFLVNLTAMDDFSTVKSIGIVRDADDNAKGVVQSIRDSLRRSDLPSPRSTLQMVKGDSRPDVVYLVVPHGDERGAIEDVCLKSVQKDHLRCVDKYMQCLDEVTPNGYEPVSKSLAHAYLATRERPGLRVGEAADAGYWDFDSPSFQPLRELISLL